MRNRVPTFDFEQLIQQDQQTKQWLKCLWVKGLAVVRSAPCKEDQLARSADRVSTMDSFTTIYGSKFTVKSKFDANNVAYTTRALPTF